MTFPWRVTHQWGGGGVTGLLCGRGNILTDDEEGTRAKVSSSLNHGLLQNYFAPFSKAAKKKAHAG